MKKSFQREKKEIEKKNLANNSPKIDILLLFGALCALMMTARKLIQMRALRQLQAEELQRKLIEFDA
jgi:hypothetical protein